MQQGLAIALLLVLAAGCTTQAKARANAKAAFTMGRRQAMVEAQQTGIFFRGDVRNPLVKWCEGLTLARALVAAEYAGSTDPVAIVITRKGESTTVDPKALLAGTTDPLVEPGDIVEIKR